MVSLHKNKLQDAWKGILSEVHTLPSAFFAISDSTDAIMLIYFIYKLMAAKQII